MYHVTQEETFAIFERLKPSIKVDKSFDTIQ